MKMHSQKLQDLPAEEAEALERSRQHAKMREDWQRQKQEFGDGVPPDGDDEPDQDGGR
jgi:hypothetical protein